MSRASSRLSMIPVATIYGAADAPAAILMGAVTITVRLNRRRLPQIMRCRAAPCGRRHVNPGVGPNTISAKNSPPRLQKANA